MQQLSNSEATPTSQDVLTSETTVVMTKRMMLYAIGAGGVQKLVKYIQWPIRSEKRYKLVDDDSQNTPQAARESIGIYSY